MYRDGTRSSSLVSNTSSSTPAGRRPIPIHRDVERVQGTILEECWKPAFARYLIPKITGLQRELKAYLRYYNYDRAHTGRWTNGRTPAQVLGGGKMYP